MTTDAYAIAHYTEVARRAANRTNALIAYAAELVPDYPAGRPLSEQDLRIVMGLVPNLEEAEAEALFCNLLNLAADRYQADQIVAQDGARDGAVSVLVEVDDLLRRAAAAMWRLDARQAEAARTGTQWPR